MSAKQFTPTVALWAGLDAAAPDEDAWLAGQAAYRASQDRGETLDDSYAAALDAAAPDGLSWLFGKQAIYRSLFSVSTLDAAGEVVRGAFRPRSRRKSAQHS